MKRTLALMLMLFLLLVSVSASAQHYRSKHIVASAYFVAAVQEDGTVKAIGDNKYGQCETEAWRDVVAISAYFSHKLGLKSDGTVYATGRNSSGECKVDGWKDIAMVVAAADCSYGLKKDGTIVWAGKLSKQDRKEIKSWKDIVWIGFRWPNSLFAIDSQGNAYAVGKDFSRLKSVAQVQEDAEQIFSFLLTDGTIKTLTPYNGYKKVGNHEWPKWINTCAIDEGGSTFMMLKLDGTVTSDSVLPYFADWTDVVEIGDGFGVKADGSILMEDEFLRYLSPEQLAEISTWKVMVDPKTIPMPAAKMEAP